MAEEEHVSSALEEMEHTLKGMKHTLEEHTRTDEHYRNMLETLYSDNYKNKEEVEMHVEVPAVVAGGNDNAALVAALMGGNRGNDGLGLGGGLAGGVLLGALLGQNGGLFGNRTGAADIGVQSAIDTNSILQGIGDLKAAVPLAEAQVQLALAASNATITQGQATINKNVSDAIAASLASQNSININVLQTAAANMSAIKDAQFAITQVVKDDGERTRALITSNQIADLQRQLSVSQIAAMEDRLTSRARDTEINITNTNTANAQQVQTQLQAQQQAQLQIQTVALLQNLIGDTQAIRQGSVVFNSGTMAGSGNQSAANTRVA